MSLDFRLCPKCGRSGMSWDGRAKIIHCLYYDCKHVIKDVAVSNRIPTEIEMNEAIELDKINNFGSEKEEGKKKKPKRVECSIYEGAMGGLQFDYQCTEGSSSTDRLRWQISKACEIPGFVGFKYDDERIAGKMSRICPSPRLYLSKNGRTYYNIQLDSLDQYEVLIPTYVIIQE